MESEGRLRWYCGPISRDAGWLHWCAPALSSSELARARRYAREPLATRFRSSHGALRWWLGKQLNVAPHEIAFTTAASGKPALDPPRDAFSFSHTQTHWAAALHLASTASIGIDIENVRRFAMPSSGLVAYVLSAEEAERWRLLGTRDAARALARVWVRKEALLKAIGTGLRRRMGSFSVGWGPGPVSVCVAGDRLRWWTVHDIYPQSGAVVGALVRAGDDLAPPLFSAIDRPPAGARIDD